jgi:hypothetical protein
MEQCEQERVRRTARQDVKSEKGKTVTFFLLALSRFTGFRDRGGCCLSGERSGIHQAFTFGFRNFSAKLLCRIQPEVDGLLAVNDSLIGCSPVGCTTGQLGNLSDERLVIAAPIDNDLVFMHYTPPSGWSPYRVITARTCRTW